MAKCLRSTTRYDHHHSSLHLLKPQDRSTYTAALQCKLRRPEKMFSQCSSRTLSSCVYSHRQSSETDRLLDNLPKVLGFRPSVSNQIRAELKAKGSKNEGIGSRRRKRGLGRKDPLELDVETRLPFLEPSIRKAKEEGHQILHDVEELHLRASNPFGLVLEIAQEANEYLRNNKEESLTRKPILKILSNKMNEVLGENLRDSYIYDRPDYSVFEKSEDPEESS